MTVERPTTNATVCLATYDAVTNANFAVWSNFEIGSLKFWRSQPYMDFFTHLDKLGGFYYERWGDAPVHSIGAALFANKSQIHFFEDIGYRHEPFQVSPSHQRDRPQIPANISTAHKVKHTQEGNAGVTSTTTSTGSGESCFAYIATGVECSLLGIPVPRDTRICSSNTNQATKHL